MRESEWLNKSNARRPGVKAHSLAARGFQVGTVTPLRKGRNGDARSRSYLPIASLRHDIYCAYGREGSREANRGRPRQRSAATKALVPSLKISS